MAIPICEAAEVRERIPDAVCELLDLCERARMKSESILQRFETITPPKREDRSIPPRNLTECLAFARSTAAITCDMLERIVNQLG